MRTPHRSARELTYIAVCTALLALCAWISVPAAVPFTMQTFAVFMTLRLLGGRNGAIAIAVYLLLGAIGLPVFSGFRSGIGVLLGTTGGYLLGFLFSALLYWLVEKLTGEKLWRQALAMMLALLVCYAFGTGWFLYIYTRANGAVALGTVLAWCVFPFIIPDLLKIGLALLLGNRLKRFVR